jgi:hypothetical protein
MRSVFSLHFRRHFTVGGVPSRKPPDARDEAQRFRKQKQN